MSQTQSQSEAVRTWIRLARIFGKIERRLATQLRAHGLSLGQFDVLAQAARQEGMTQQELADYLLVTKGNISHHVSNLEERGLLQRRTGPGRSCRLHVTDEGNAMLSQVMPEHVAEISGCFGTTDESMLIELHEKVRTIDLGMT